MSMFEERSNHPRCYGSDEEQTRTATTNAAENYIIHTEFCSKVKEREKDEEQHT